MVKGLDIFKKAFADYPDSYVIIGGAACDFHETVAGQNARATKDLDIILVIEALDHHFVQRFWEFIKEGDYSEKQRGEFPRNYRHKYYRFKNPTKRTFPAQIELFSRVIDNLVLPEEQHIIPIRSNSDLSSLSAILLDDTYYYYTINHSRLYEGIHFANIESLIALKCKAYIENVPSLSNNNIMDSKHLKKHKNDIFRLVAAIPTAIKEYKVPKKIFDDINLFCELVVQDMPDQNLIRDMGLRGITPEQILHRLTSMFILEEN